MTSKQLLIPLFFVVSCGWLFVLYYYYEEITVAACTISKQPEVIWNATTCTLPPTTTLPPSTTTTTTTTNTTSSQLDPPTNDNIALVFIILSHNLKTIKTALAIIEILHHPRNYFVVHVDRRVPKEEVQVLHDQIQLNGYQHVRVISTQTIQWGGRELLAAALDGASLALSEWNWHYMFLMSGDCLPVKPLSHIQHRMTEFWPKNNLAIVGQHVESRKEVGPSKKGRFHLADDQPYDSLVAGLNMVYYGTTWVTLTRPFIAWALADSFSRNFLLYVVAHHVDRDPDTGGLPSIFEESYFQTIIYHGPFNNTVGGADKCIRFEKWGGCNYDHADRPVPCMLGEKDKSEIDNTDCLFARKFVYSELPSFITSQIHVIP